MIQDEDTTRMNLLILCLLLQPQPDLRTKALLSDRDLIQRHLNTRAYNTCKIVAISKPVEDEDYWLFESVPGRWYEVKVRGLGTNGEWMYLIRYFAVGDAVSQFYHDGATLNPLWDENLALSDDEWISFLWD